MAALTHPAPAPAAPSGAAAGRNRIRRPLPAWRWVILLVTAVYFLLPLWGALRFSGISAFSGVISEDGFGSSLWLS
ncbi:MAG: hypothetical protein ACRDP7_42580, partial [Trebonia sp.]